MEKKFTYHIEHIKSQPLYETTRVLNELGKDGWELITVIGEYYYFKKTI